MTKLLSSARSGGVLARRGGILDPGEDALGRAEPTPGDGRSSLPSGVTARLGPPAVEADSLAWTYLRRPRPALHDVSFRLEPGRVLLVLGPSGCGKSTLARALVGLVPHVLPGSWRGSLRIGGASVADTPARILGERVGLVFQDPDSQLVMARVADEVAFGLENRGRPREEMVAAVPRALEAVGLAGFEPRSTAMLSGGEKQRLAIADVLAAGPSLLVFDEPTANLDPPGMHDTIDRLAALAATREHTIVLIEHRLEAALPIADDLLLLDDSGGQIDFTPAANIRADSVEVLARTGAWVPRAWRGAGLDRTKGGRPAGEKGPTESAASPDPADTATAPPTATSTPASPVLHANALSVEYPLENDAGARRAVDGVSLAVAGAERVALVGPNGSGKSSLLLALAGLVRPAAGEVRCLGRNPARLRSRDLPATIGVVFQDPELGFVARTVREEVRATPRAIGRKTARIEADAILHAFGLGALEAVEPYRLSQGEQRRLSLAAYALAPPAVLLLDEPTFGLDRRGTEAVFDLLDRLRACGQAQVLATHDPRLLSWCDRVVALERGRVVFDGSPSAFLAAPPFAPSEPWTEAT